MTRLLKSYLNEQIQDSEFCAAYEALAPQFQVANEVLAMRLHRGLTQAELAKRAGTTQSCISRLENASAMLSLSFLQRIARALGARLEIRLVPLESPAELPSSLGVA